MLTNGQLALLIAGRLTINTAFRVVYALLTFLAVSFGVDITTVSLLITMQVAATLLSPLGGTLADTRGERFTMLLGLSVFVVGAGICMLASSFGLFLAGYGLIGLGMALFQPAVQAYASMRTPYARRGWVLGMLELSWAFAALVGVAALSWLAEATNSRSPIFQVLFVAGLLVMSLMRFGLPPDTPRPPRHRDLPLFDIKLLTKPSIAAAMALMFTSLLGAELVFVVYAPWLERDFHATVEQLGMIFGLLGLVELGGSFGAALFVDRIGKRRAVIIGYLATGTLQALLPFSAGNWPLFFVLFLTFGICFEFAIVSSFPLISGLVPSARGTILSLSVAFVGGSRVIGSLLGPAIWQQLGFMANGLLAAMLSFSAVVICWRLVREGEG